MSDLEAAQKTMFSAYTNSAGRVVLVAINYATEAQRMRVKLQNGRRKKTVRSYVTTAAQEDNMRATVLKSLDDLVLPARSITTFVVD